MPTYISAEGAPEVWVGVLQSCCVACDLEALSPAAPKSNQPFSCLLQQHKKLRGLCLATMNLTHPKMQLMQIPAQVIIPSCQKLYLWYIVTSYQLLKRFDKRPRHSQSGPLWTSPHAFEKPTQC